MAARRRPRRYEPVTISTRWLEACQRFAYNAFAAAPKAEHINRPEPSGNLAAAFFLPLPLLETQNIKRKAPAWAIAKRFEELQHVLGVQNRFRDHRHIAPIEGRPLVLCTRFSSHEPDRYSDGFKWVVDALCVPTKQRRWGLGYLRDDRPKDAEIVQWWEPGPRGGGFGLVRVFERGQGRS